MPNRPFTIGTRCKTKSKPARFCQILSVDPNATRKNIWVVKFADDGSTKGDVKSQQLLKLAPNDEYPEEDSQDVTAATESETLVQDDSDSDTSDEEDDPDLDVEEDVPTVIQ